MVSKCLTKQIVAKIKRTLGVCNSIKNTNATYYDVLLSIIKNHPEYHEIFEPVKDILINTNPKYKHLEFSVLDETGFIKPISLNTCISGKRLNNQYNLQMAMRNAIEEQILDFRSKSVLVCDLCNSEEQIHIDHDKPQFVELVDEFLEDFEEKDIPKEFDKDSGHTPIFKYSDEEFENQWVKFHSDKAKLRVLCKKCNCSREKKRLRKMTWNS